MEEKIQKSEALANLRDKFFDKCTEPVYEVNQLTGDVSATIVRKVSLAPHDLFEWFVNNMEHCYNSPSVETEETDYREGNRMAFKKYKGNPNGK